MRSQLLALVILVAASCGPNITGNDAGTGGGGSVTGGGGGSVNTAPVPTDDAFSSAEDSVLGVMVAQLLTNDTDAETPGALSVTAVGNATQGSVQLAAGQITFTPTADFNGSASFEYTLSDGSLTATGVVRVTVTPVNDAPLSTADTFTTPEDTALTLAVAQVLANDTDVDSTGLQVTAVGNPINGTVQLAAGQITFTPGVDFNGMASFEYTLSDGALSTFGAVAVTVTAVNDAPVAVDDAFATDEDTNLTLAVAQVLANDVDVDSTGLQLTAVANALQGTVALSAGQITFSPAADFNGAATFEYTLSDGTAVATGQVSINVRPVNDPPVAVNDAFTTAEDVALTLTSAQVLANDVDADVPSSLSVTSVSNATHGTVVLAAGQIIFTPEGDYFGPASFDYAVSDGTSSSTAAVQVTVSPVDDPPVAGAQTLSTGRNTPLAITLTASDADTQQASLTFTIDVAAAHGTVTGTPPAVMYTPNAGYFGADSFGFSVSDGTSTSSATVSLTVIATVVCGDGLTDAPEECDDGNLVDTDGCTTACVIGPPCDVAALPGADRFATDRDAGTCYASFDDEQGTFAQAQTQCIASGGALAVITSAGEQALVSRVQNTSQNPWLGAVDDTNTTDAIFTWVTGEPWAYTHFAAGQPDDDASTGGNGNCLHLVNAAGEWNDTNCDFVGFVTGRVCEIPVQACGDGILQASRGEACDDRNRVRFDGCSPACRLESLFFSEYVEGSSNNKAVEIFNPFSTPVNLTGCSLRLYSNGAVAPSTTLALTQTIASHDVLVACNPSSSAALLATCDVTNSAVNFNGDDAIELFCNGSTVDAIGQVGFDPGTNWGAGVLRTVDQTLRRKCVISTGDGIANNVFDPAPEWDGFAIDTFAGLGAHSCP
ncbi:MAG: Ig-like domain-containing protein [Archangium sp.]|nr:Ig-like domain-containing protein [Archangium sp.]